MLLAVLGWIIVAVSTAFKIKNKELQERYEAGLSRTEGRSSSGYPYITEMISVEEATKKRCSRSWDKVSTERCKEFGYSCNPQPSLKASEIVEIAELAKVDKPRQYGFWVVEYGPSYTDSEIDPFSNHCLWTVRSLELVDEGDFFERPGELLYISDATKKYWRTKIYPNGPDMPPLEEIKTAP